jgi:hypothetical protein
MLGQIIDLYNDFRAFRAQATNTRIARLDNLDATVSSRQPTATALTQHNALLKRINDASDEALTTWQRAVFNAPGAFTFVVPANVFLLFYDYCGGGGGGASGSTGRPGGGAASVMNMIAVVEPGQIITGVIGAGGVVASPGTAGAATTISLSDLFANPGQGGSSAGGGQGGAVDSPLYLPATFFSARLFAGGSGQGSGQTAIFGRSALASLVPNAGNGGIGGVSATNGCPGAAVLRWLGRAS